MLILISPAKTFDFNSSLNFKENTKPLFEADANKLVKYLIPLGENGIKEIMNISDNLQASIWKGFKFSQFKK